MRRERIELRTKLVLVVKNNNGYGNLIVRTWGSLKLDVKVFVKSVEVEG